MQVLKSKVKSNRAERLFSCSVMINSILGDPKRSHIYRQCIYDYHKMLFGFGLSKQDSLALAKMTGTIYGPLDDDLENLNSRQPTHVFRKIS